MRVVPKRRKEVALRGLREVVLKGRGFSRAAAGVEEIGGFSPGWKWF